MPLGRLSSQAMSARQPSLPSLATEPFSGMRGEGSGKDTEHHPPARPEACMPWLWLARLHSPMTQRASTQMKLTPPSRDQTAPLCTQHLTKGAAETRPVPRGQCTMHQLCSPPV